MRQLKILIVRAQPVVLVDAYVRYRTAKKQIDIKQKNCHIPNGLEAICTDIDFCIKYTGKGIPQQLCEYVRNHTLKLLFKLNFSLGQNIKKINMFL